MKIIKITIVLLALVYAGFAGELASLLGMPVVLCALPVFLGSIVLLWFVVGLCDAAKTTDEAIDKAAEGD